MEHAPGIMATIGLRHVLEDGAAVLGGGGVDGERRSFVLRDLKEMLQHATTGAQVSEARHSLIQAADPSALKVYSLIFKYLNSEYKESLQTTIARTYTTIADIDRGAQVAPEEREAARSFVGRLLARLNSDEVYSQQREPEIFSFQ